MAAKFARSNEGLLGELCVQDCQIKRVDSFRYLGSLVIENGLLDEEIHC
jgi:hypothetical protein